MDWNKNILRFWLLPILLSTVIALLTFYDVSWVKNINFLDVGLTHVLPLIIFVYAIDKGHSIGKIGVIVIFAEILINIIAGLFAIIISKTSNISYSSIETIANIIKYLSIAKSITTVGITVLETITLFVILSSESTIARVFKVITITIVFFISILTLLDTAGSFSADYYKNYSFYSKLSKINSVLEILKEGFYYSAIILYLTSKKTISSNPEVEELLEEINRKNKRIEELESSSNEENPKEKKVDLKKKFTNPYLAEKERILANNASKMAMNNGYNHQNPNMMNNAYPQQNPNMMNNAYPQQNPNMMNNAYPQQNPNMMNNTYPQQNPNMMNNSYPQQNPNMMNNNTYPQPSNSNIETLEGTTNPRNM